MKEVLFTAETKISYQQENPKKAGAQIRYEKYKKAKTVAEFYQLGGATGDLKYDYGKGFLTIVSADGKSANSGTKAGSIKVVAKVASSSSSSSSKAKEVKSDSSGSKNAAASTVSTQNVAKAKGKASAKSGVKRKATMVTSAQKVKRAKLNTGKAKDVDGDAVENSANAEGQAASSSKSAKGKTTNKKKVAKTAVRWQLSDDEIGFRLFRKREGKRMSLFDDVRQKWNNSSADVKRRYMKEGKAIREKEKEKERIRKERGPAFSTFSTSLVLQRKNVKAKDLPTMRAAMPSWTFPKNLPKISIEPPAPTDDAQNGDNLLAKMSAPLAQPLDVLKGAKLALIQLGSDSKNKMNQLGGALRTMKMEIDSFTNNLSSTGKQGWGSQMFGHFRKKEDSHCKHLFDHADQYPVQVTKLMPTAAEAPTMHQKRPMMTSRLRAFSASLENAIEKSSTRYRYPQPPQDSVDDPDQILQGIELTVRTVKPLTPEEQADPEMVRSFKEKEKEMKMKTFCKAVENANKAAQELRELYKQRCSLWLRLLKMNAETLNPQMWKECEAWKPNAPPGILVPNLHGSEVEPVQVSGVFSDSKSIEGLTHLQTTSDVVRACAGFEPAALYAAIGAEGQELPWQELDIKALSSSPSVASTKDMEACTSLWSTIDKPRKHWACTHQFMMWLKAGQPKDGECSPFRNEKGQDHSMYDDYQFMNSSGKWWFCENCKAWEQAAMKPYHAACGVRGGKPAMFSEDSGEGFNNTLQYYNRDGEVEVELLANFKKILSQLLWATFWPSDQTEAFFRLVPHALPTAPEGLKIEVPKSAPKPQEARDNKRKSLDPYYHPYDPYGYNSESDETSDDSDGMYGYGNFPYGHARGNPFGGPQHNMLNAPSRHMSYAQRRQMLLEQRRNSRLGLTADSGASEDLGPQFSMASCTDLNPTEQPSGFRLPLYNVQLKTLSWMKEREGSALEYLSREVIKRQFMCTDVDVELRVDRHWKGVRGGIMADAVGYGKTACCIGLVHEGLKTPLAQVLQPEEFTDLSKRFILSSATLIITPPNLFEQWLGEFKKFLHPELFDTCRIIEIPHIHRLNKLSVEDLANADVVILPYRFFFSNVYNNYFDETIQKTDSLYCSSNSKADRSYYETTRYSILREYVKQLLKPPASGTEVKQTSVGQTLPAKVLESVAPTLEAFYWKRVVFDEFHEVLGIREGRPYHALRQCFAKYHWGLTATPRLGNAADISDMASLLHISIPSQDYVEAQHFIDEWVRSSTWDTSTVPLENRVVYVQHTKQERLLYLHQKNQVLNRTGGSVAAGEEMLLKLCTHYSPNGDLEDLQDAESATAAVCRRQSELHDQLEEKKQLLKAAEDEFPFQKRRMEAQEKLYDLFTRIGLPSGRDAIQMRAELSVNDANRLGGDRSPEQMEKLIKEIEEHAPPVDETLTAEQLLAQQQNFKPSEQLTQILKSLVKSAAKARRKDHEPKYEYNGPSLVGRVHTLEGQIKKHQSSIKELEISIRFFENTFKLLEDDQGDGLECAICMDDGDKSQKSITRCGHIFHDSCIKMVIDEHKSCPTCRCQLARKDASPVEKVLSDKKGSTVPENEELEAPKFGSKMAKIVETLRQIRAEEPGAKVIMFCQWDRILKFISGVLAELGEPKPLQLRGTSLQRQGIIRDFLSSTKKENGVLLLSLEQSPTGMNLVQCHHVFLIHPMHAQTKERAVAFELQAIGRVRRQGQEKKVVVHRFVTQNTVEEEITKRHQTHLDEAEEKATDEKAKKDAQIAQQAKALAKEYKTLIKKVFEEKDSSKVSDVPRLMDKYKGKEKELYLELCLKYKIKAETDVKPKVPATKKQKVASTSEASSSSSSSSRGVLSAAATEASSSSSGGGAALDASGRNEQEATAASAVAGESEVQQALACEAL
eukprot:gnl/MRDRNA2_/MRDRNA2_62227_c0_seq1.p1 gnl/MRDRNA2_/MRDRNA2_62227_c0~~gnl/MRDRNA2_/MRDRNA2_62227_c0_seq1.p1  ORF type:complete len:1902 (+),score=464.19 gnl/MRDRNA2_/MRDRNA2_62227_c0_seq1:92-5797(+)